MKRLMDENLTKSELLITRTILQEKDNMRDLGIEELSHKAAVSNALVVKYAKKLGFSGYKELKYYVMNHANNDTLEVNNFIEFQEAKIASFFKYIKEDPTVLSDLVQMINEAEEVTFYAQGPSHGIASYFAPRFTTKTAKPFLVVNDEQQIDIKLQSPKPKQLIIILSASLKTDSVNERIKALKSSLVNYVVLHENTNLDLANFNGIKLSDYETEYDYMQVRDRTLYSIYLELVLHDVKGA